MIVRRWSLSNNALRFSQYFICGHCTRRVQHIYFSTSTRLSTYSDTVSNLRIGPHTRVIFQGFTGRQVCSDYLERKISGNWCRKATQDAKQSLEYGTKIVGGVTPGKNGEHLGLPVLPSVRTVSEISLPFTSYIVSVDRMDSDYVFRLRIN